MHTLNNVNQLQVFSVPHYPGDGLKSFQTPLPPKKERKKKLPTNFDPVQLKTNANLWKKSFNVRPWGVWQLTHSSSTWGQVLFAWENKCRRKRESPPIVHKLRGFQGLLLFIWRPLTPAPATTTPRFPRLKCMNTSPLHVLVVQVRWVHGKKAADNYFSSESVFHLTFSNKKESLPHVIPELS